MSMIESSGMNVNRMLDRLGLPESFGDAIGAMIDGQRGDMGGMLRNLFDLQSGVPTKALDQALSQSTTPAFARGFVPRGTVNDQHLAQQASTYPLSREVGHNAYIGQKYNFNVGPFQCQGRITGNQYAGSFSKPVQLGNDKFLFHGKTYNGLNDIFRDIRDGKIDGNVGGRIPSSMIPHFPSMAAGVAQGNATSGPSDLAQQLIQSIFGPQQGGASSGAKQTGAASSAAGDTGAEGASDIMSGPGSLEDKLLLLMDKLAKFMDKQIEDQMQKIEQEMQKQKQGGQAGGSGGGGGLLGTLGGIAGGAVGGPLGGMAGSALGNAVGGATSGGTGGSGSSSEGDKSNLQLLQSQLQQMIERRNQMFQTMTQMLKSLNDTSLAIIRNLKA